eukprot:11761634-Alexandrium_andersonii.AAC.1
MTLQARSRLPVESRGAPGHVGFSDACPELMSPSCGGHGQDHLVSQVVIHTVIRARASKASK